MVGFCGVTGQKFSGTGSSGENGCPTPHKTDPIKGTLFTTTPPPPSDHSQYDLTPSPKKPSAEDKNTALRSVASALGFQVTTPRFGSLTITNPQVSRPLLFNSMNKSEFVELLCYICYLDHQPKNDHNLERQLSQSLIKYINNHYHISASGQGLCNSFNLHADLITLVKHRDCGGIIRSLPNSIMLILKVIYPEEDNYLQQLITDSFTDITEYIKNPKGDQYRRTPNFTGIKYILERDHLFSRGERKNIERTPIHIHISALNQEEFAKLQTTLSSPSINELIRNSLPPHLEDSYKEQILSNLSTFLKTTTQSQLTFEAFNASIKQLQGLLTPVNNHLELIEQTDLTDIYNIAMLVVMYKEFILTNFPVNSGVLFSKHLIFGYHSLLLFKDAQGKFKVLIKPIIKNVAPQENLLAKGGIKLIKLSGIIIEAEADNLFSTRSITTSRLTQLETNRFHRETPLQTLARNAKQLIEISEYRDPLLKEGFQIVTFFDQKLKTSRTLYIAKYLGITLAKKLQQISLFSKNSDHQQFLQNICLQLCQKFRTCFSDIKISNVLIDTLDNVEFIDYSDPKSHTFVYKDVITNKGFTDLIRPKNAIFCLCYALFKIVRHTYSSAVDNFEHFSPQFIFSTYNKGQMIPDNLSFHGNGYNFSAHPLRECLNKAYRGELQLGDLEKQLNEIFQTGQFTDAFVNASDPIEQPDTANRE